MLIDKEHWALWQPVFDELANSYAFKDLATHEGIEQALHDAAKRPGGCYGEEIFTSAEGTIEIEFHKTGSTKSSHLNILSVVLAYGPLLAVATKTSILHHAASSPNPGCSYWNVLGEHAGVNSPDGLLLERCCHAWEVEETNRHATMLSRYERTHVKGVSVKERARLYKLHYKIAKPQLKDRKQDQQQEQDQRAGEDAVDQGDNDNSPELDRLTAELERMEKRLSDQEKPDEVASLREEWDRVRGRESGLMMDLFTLNPRHERQAGTQAEEQSTEKTADTANNDGKGAIKKEAHGSAASSSSAARPAKRARRG